MCARFERMKRVRRNSELEVPQGLSIVHAVDAHERHHPPALKLSTGRYPHRPDCGFAYKGMASCGLALSVAAALRKELGVQLDLRYWLDLVAVGTVADVAPLDGDNRALVRAGLTAILEAQRPGMQALLEVAKISRETPITGRDVAFRIAPQLNAPGRLGSADLALELLLATDLASARGLAARLDQLSAERRAQSDLMLEQALEDIATHGFADDAALVLGRRGWNPGVVGIVAGRLADRFARPVIVVGFDGETGRGSVRGPAGSRLHDALCLAQEALVRFGGHQQAAGVELLESRLDELRARFVDAIQNQPPAPRVDTSAELLFLQPGDSPLAVLNDLDRLEPCGFGNPRPKLRAVGEVREAREVKNGHLKLRLDLGRHGLACFAVRQACLAVADLKGLRYVELENAIIIPRASVPASTRKLWKPWPTWEKVTASVDSASP